MTVEPAAGPAASRALGLCRQLLMVILINVPTVSLGLAMGWVSLASGESSAWAGGGARLVGAAATTFGASLLGVPLSARMLAAGRKPAIVATSLAFVVCWALKLASLGAGGAGGWWVLAARVAAGFGGAGAYSIPPLLAREMCERAVAGAAVAALVLAHNLGILLMYVAADQGAPHRAVLWGCLALSAVHCVVFLFVPESPAFLAANGKHEAARSSLAWLRGAARGDPALQAELAALPLPDTDSTLQTLKELVSDRMRRRAFIIALVAVVGQETCGIFTLIQFAERTFMLARDERAEHAEHAGHAEHAEHAQPIPGALVTPARYALLLGVVQLLASTLALYLVERVGRRPLIVHTAWLTGLCLAGAALSVRLALPPLAAGALLAAAVACDSAGLQPAPYALLADMFHYKFRSSALLVATAASCVGNALEVALFPALAAHGALWAALAAAAACTLLLALFAALAVPETRHREPEDVYRELARAPLPGLARRCRTHTTHI